MAYGTTQAIGFAVPDILARIKAFGPAQPVVAREKLGINVVGNTYYGGEPIFANQLQGLRWLVPYYGYQGISDALLRPDGFPLSVDGTSSAPVVISILNPPLEAKITDDAVSRVTWQGTGEVSLGGAYPITRDAHSMTFKWKKAINEGDNRVYIQIDKSSASDPIRAMDCRLTTDPANAMFSQQLLNYLAAFGVLRFLDWTSTNRNPGSVTWANRAQPGSLVPDSDLALPIEHMIALANAVGSSPWFPIPWNADADYHRRMAQLIFDTVPSNKPVYVENSNEVWNYSFGQTGQAQQEGLDRGLSTAGLQAALRRHAQKTFEVMTIWTDVFKSRPSSLVRVVATQATLPWAGMNLFEWENGKLAEMVDAIAIAPYFSVDANTLTNDLDTDMATLAQKAKDRIALESKEYKTIADRWGKRLIAYEGGQHQIDSNNVPRLAAMNRDPRMQAIYKQYLTDWNVLTDDLFTLYSSTTPINQFGAWGLREYAGQPIGETPKLRGVLEFAGRLGSG